MEEIFLKAIVEEPNIDIHKLAYQDWLEEQGNTKRLAGFRFIIDKKLFPNHSYKYSNTYPKPRCWDWWGTTWDPCHNQWIPFLIFSNLKNYTTGDPDRYREYSSYIEAMTAFLDAYESVYYDIH